MVLYEFRLNHASYITLQFFGNIQLHRLLQNNAISGPIPSTISKLEKLETLDLSSNNFNGEIPDSLGDLKSLNYL